MAGGTEEIQELGRRGVYEVKEWLESTARYQFNFSIYDNKSMCSVSTFDPTSPNKSFDLEGQLVAEKQPVSVECKNYSTVGGQSKEFQKFLAIAYSSTVRNLEEHSSDWGRHFIWVTFHPFDQSKWPKLTKIKYMKKCLTDYPDYLGGRQVDDDLVAEVVDRVSLYVVRQKQMHMRLTKKELLKVRKALEIGV